jgi:hypothetical protein
MPELLIDLRFNSDQVLRYYRGEVLTVRARATNGQTIQFPASALQRFILQDGVRGRFRLVFDDNNKFVALEQVT